MIHVLSEQRCYDLLTATTVGRAGYVREGVVEIIPMNYAVSGHDLLLRTGSDGALSVLADAGATVSFEVDHLDSLELPEADRNLVVTFHYYAPFAFTHQGASWVQELKNTSGVTWGTPA